MLMINDPLYSIIFPLCDMYAYEKQHLQLLSLFAVVMATLGLYVL